MFHSHTSVFSRTAFRCLLVVITGILIALGVTVFCQTALTEDARAGSPEEAAAMAQEDPRIEAEEVCMETDEILPETDEGTPDDGDGPEGIPADSDEPEGAPDDEDPAGTEDAHETGDGGSVCDDAAVAEADIDTESAADADGAVIVLSEDTVDPEPLTVDAYEDDSDMEGIGTEEADESDPGADPLATENIKLRSGGVSADPMDVLLGVVAQHQRQGNNIQVISSDPLTGRVVYATD